ncbi:MAG TPA: hypothetical protein VFE59_41355 [Trebonia sp.]|nr:hypothetical protein [Trebonia sp.]
MVSRALLFHPRQGNPAGGLPDGRFRAALGALFPVAPSVPPRLPRERLVRACIEILAGLAVAVAMLFRVAHIPAWDLVYAEDNGVFLVGALAHPWHLLTPFGGYLELVPRILGQIVSLLPLWDAPRIYAASGVLIAAVCAPFTYHASAGYIRSPWLRAMLGAAWVLITGDKQVRVFAVLATVTGFAEVIAVASVPGPPGGGWVAHEVAIPAFQPGSRYDALPVMLLDAMVIIAVDAFVRRRSAVTLTPLLPSRPSWLGPRPWTLVVVAALTCALASGWITDYRYYSPSRVSQGYWTHTVHHWLTACASTKTGEISLPTWDAPKATVPCSAFTPRVRVVGPRPQET